VVIRRLAARDALPPSFRASIPPSPRAAPASPDRTASASEAATTPDGLPEPEQPEPTPAARG
jgi:hypothetical protein